MRVLFAGARVDPVPSGDPTARFNATGKNTGNLLIGASLKRQLAFSSYSDGLHRPAEAVDDEFDLIAIPASNFIFRGFDFGYLADYLSKSTIPVLTVGLGAQMPSTTQVTMDVPAGTQRFLKIIAERGREIGVRGEFTASVLEKFGITNVRITGCPSYYINMRRNIKIRKTEFHSYLRVSVNGSRNVIGHSYDPDMALYVESELLRLAQRNRYDYVLQNEYPEIDVLLTGGTPSNELYNQLSTLAKRHRLEISTEDYIAYIRTHGRIFFDVDEWASYIRNKDFSIGSRFHGNMIALLNGIPAVLFAHDSRTIEMADFMAIPYHKLGRHDFQNLKSLYETTEFERFERGYAAAFERYVVFLERNNVAHNLIVD